MTKSSVINRISAIIQFILGFILGVTLMAGVAAGAAYLYFRQMSVAPKKPAFAEVEPPALEQNSNSAQTDNDANDTNEPEVAVEPEPEPELPPDEVLPANAYKAKVTWPQGLSLRETPANNATRIGGISYNAEIIILEDSDDKQWQRVRIPTSGKEGWVKAGNVRRIDS